jgi:preprotein translocase subunit SecY
MLSAFANSLKIPELRARIFFTFGMIFICRIIASIPAPGVDIQALKVLMDTIAGSSGAGGMVGLFNIFTGGALENFAVGALGIMPYISASIILQLMTAVVPTLQRLAREGEPGRQKITQYTRYLTLVLCVVQGWVMAAALEGRPPLDDGRTIVLAGGLGFRLTAVIALTTGTCLLMWLGEQITDRGIGNGTSLIISVNIVSQLPAAVKATVQMFTGDGAKSPFLLILLTLTFFLVTAATVAMTQAQRKIPVQYARRVVGNKVYGGGGTFMPLRVNYAGVMPIIFGQAILMFPGPILNLINAPWASRLANAFQPGNTWYTVIYITVILFFSYFWVATQFNPIQIADDLKRNGGYVPGIRPGKPTADFLDYTMTRITLAGALFLAVLALFPMLMGRRFNIDQLISGFFGGTSMLIMVGVMLDTMRQIEAHLLNRHYDGFLRKGKLRGRG